MYPPDGTVNKHSGPQVNILSLEQRKFSSLERKFNSLPSHCVIFTMQLNQMLTIFKYTKREQFWVQGMDWCNQIIHLRLLDICFEKQMDSFEYWE